MATLPGSRAIPSRVGLPDTVASALRSRISDREWDVGEKIPSESALAGEYGVSRATVRAAIKALMATGLLHARQGAGTFVAAGAGVVGIGLQELRSTTETIRAHGLDPSVHCRLAEMRPATAECVSQTGINPDAQVLYLERSIRAGGALFGFAFDEIIPFESFSVDASTYSRSLFSEMERVLGTRPTQAKANINAVLEPGLGWGDGIPDPPLYLRFTQTHVQADGTPVLFSRNYFVEGVVSFSIWRN